MPARNTAQSLEARTRRLGGLDAEPLLTTTCESDSERRTEKHEGYAYPDVDGETARPSRRERASGHATCTDGKARRDTVLLAVLTGTAARDGVLARPGAARDLEGDAECARGAWAHRAQNRRGRLNGDGDLGPRLPARAGYGDRATPGNVLGTEGDRRAARRVLLRGSQGRRAKQNRADKDASE